MLTLAGDFHDADVELRLPYHGPCYSPHALLAVDEFVSDLLADLAANGVPVNQLHAEYGQLRLSSASWQSMSCCLPRAMSWINTRTTRSKPITVA
ncbi:MAG TPA: hypothetical protein VFW69_24545 [Mycobacterium sp.]|nr:hypothetical protein [Mycobacterium sp.]